MMYRIINGEPVEVVRWGDEILPATDDRTKQIVGQGVLFLYDQDSGNITQPWTDIQ